ncbi:MAG: hypothetical protein V3U19_10590 [Thermodesulfobacteriota bacterium]
MEAFETILVALIVALVGYLVLLSRKLNEVSGDLHELHDVMIGSKTKGEAGERLLKSMIQPLIGTGFIETNLEIKGRNTFVEFGFKIDADQFVPIDSKWDGNPRTNIEDMKNKYLGAENTTSFGILSVPDKNFEGYEKNLGYAKERGVFIVRDSMVFPTLGIVKMFYEKYKASEEVEELFKTLENWNVYKVDVKKSFDEVEQKMGKLRKSVYQEF